MRSNILVRLLGSLGPLVHSDTATLDCWLWVRSCLPLTNNGEKLLDVGCGTGAFSICAEKRGLQEETGWHVRRGYTKCMLEELCLGAGFKIEEFDHNVGWLSQRTIFVFQKLKRVPPLAWLAILPMRLVVPLIDRAFTRFFGRKFFSISVEAYRPRF